MFLGNIGAIDRYQHSVMGDIVNTASRIEGMNKHLGTRVLVSTEVVDQLGGVLTRELGAFRLKGKSQPIGIHELVCRMSEADGKQKDACGSFAEGLAAYRNRSWDDAIGKFRRSFGTLEHDEPSRYYIALCEGYRINPPEEGWDGVVQMDKK
jgi:adenylate cyclase